MSNPTSNAECTAAEAFKHAGENIVFASGSPFDNVALGNGKIGHVNQANNMYLFPGIGLGSLLSGARIITDDMLQAAAECLASYITDEEIQRGILYPSIDRAILSDKYLYRPRAGLIIPKSVEEKPSSQRCWCPVSPSAFKLQRENHFRSTNSHLRVECSAKCEMNELLKKSSCIKHI